jgi:hypothetical protein
MAQRIKMGLRDETARKFGALHGAFCDRYLLCALEATNDVDDEYTAVRLNVE